MYYTYVGLRIKWHPRYLKMNFYVISNEYFKNYQFFFGLTIHIVYMLTNLIFIFLSLIIVDTSSNYI